MDQQVVRRHGGLGIASFIIALICLIALVMIIAVLGVLGQQGRATGTEPLTNLLGIGMLLVLFVDLIGVVLGVAGAVDRTSKKVFPILGLVFGVGLLLLGVGLIVVGLYMKQKASSAELDRWPLDSGTYVSELGVNDWQIGDSELQVCLTFARA
jgi:hypothetical protein